MTRKPFPGKNLQLTIDLDLQAVAELTMENRRGAVVALDPRNGEVLAMVSRPAFDPNLFAGRIRSKDWKVLLDNPDHPLLNRAIQAQQAPGSTFKPIMALAGLETGVIDDNFRINCPGGATFYGRFFKCWGKHGTVGLHEGLVHSCDTFFYNVGNRLGIDRIAQYAEMVGYGHKTGIDLPHEAEGLVPSSDWKIRNFRERWYPSETISVAIGQGATTVTPLQMAGAIGGMSIGGMWFQPHLVKDAVHLMPARARRSEPGKYRQSGLRNVWRGEREAAPAYARTFPAWTYAARPAPRSSLRTLVEGNLLRCNHKDNAWFVGFAPCDNPEIVVAALFENGEHGQLAAPIVRDVLKAYFDKKARLGAAPAADRPHSYRLFTTAFAAVLPPCFRNQRFGQSLICQHIVRSATSTG